jgi:hypothetical protein
VVLKLNIPTVIPAQESLSYVWDYGDCPWDWLSLAAFYFQVNAVIIGLGAGLLPMFLHGCMPSLQIEVIVWFKNIPIQLRRGKVEQ